MSARARRIALWTGGVLLMPLLLAALVLWWAGSEGSLARALQQAQRWMPEGQQLITGQVQGSLSDGGRIDRLQWIRPGLTVTIDDLRLNWSLRQLFRGELRVRALSARRVHVRSTPQPDKPDDPFTMPAQVLLPIRLSVPLSVARVEIEKVDERGLASTQVLEEIAAGYRYDGELHQLQLTSLRHGQSRAQGIVQLNGRTLVLSSELTASLRNLVPDTPFVMQAKLSAKGQLGGGDAAVVDVSLDARQQEAAGAPAQIGANARIHPWRNQPAQQVHVQLDHLNAHAFHAGAPVTALRGRATLEPQAAGVSWTAALDIANDLPAPWDQQRLPLRQFKARAALSLEQLNIQSAVAELGGKKTLAGTVTLRGGIPLKQSNRASLQLDLQQVDLRQLVTALPRTSLTGPLSLAPWQQGQRIQADLRNGLAGPVDTGLVPLDRLLADLRQSQAQWRLEQLEALSGRGRVSLRGVVAPRTQSIDLHAELQQVPLRAIHRKMAHDAASRLSGTLAASGNLRRGIAFEADVGSETPDARATAPRGQWEIRDLSARGTWSSSRLVIERLHVDAFQATADGSNIDVTLPGLESVKARLEAAAPGVKVTADAAMSPQTGGGRIAVQLASAGQMMEWFRGLPSVGGLLPKLSARGAASLDATWQGNWRQWVAGLKNPASQPGLHLIVAARSEGLAFDVPETATQSATHLEIRRLDLNARGNLRAASLALSADARANDTAAVVEARVSTAQSTSRSGVPRWSIAIDEFTASATLPGESDPWKLQVSDNLQLTMQAGPDIQLGATAGTATLSAPARVGTDEPLKVSWQPVEWRRTARGAMTLQGAGVVSGMQPAWLEVLLADKGEGPLAAAGMRTDLVLSGEWDVRMTDRVAIRAHVKRERGDLQFMDSDVSAGIRAFDVTVQANGEEVNAALDWDTEHAGVITARAATRLTRQADGWSLPPNAPLSGTIQAKLGDLSSWAFLAPPGWRIQGEIDAGVRLSGTVRRPLLDGSIEGRSLNVRSVLDGVDLHNGTLRAALHASRMDVSELTFEGGTGSRAYVRGFSGNRTAPPKDRGRMTARGYIDWSRVPDRALVDARSAGTRIVMNMDAELQRMQVLVRNDRQMTLSGKLSASLNEGALRVRGDLSVDRASIVLPEASAPTLGDDVVITRGTRLRNAGAAEARQARTELDTRKPLDMDIRLDLGRDLALEGQGITTRLEGELTVRSATTGSDPFRVFGEVRTVEGRYRAWGQALDVETGIVRFNGPYGNPSLDLLAIRPKIEVRAGVHVTGTLLAPRVQLFSEPDLPEGEKLSWVVLGRAAVITGAEGSSMQQAALGLAAGQLGGRLASGLGLDELGLSESGVSIGKRISNELYLTYQQGLAGAASTLFIFYDITRRLTVRAQASEASAVDLVYTIKFD